MRVALIAALSFVTFSLFDEMLFYGSHVAAIAAMLQAMRRGLGW
jgi:hypothetical protein